MDLKDNISQLDKNFEFVTACCNGGGRTATGENLMKELGGNAVWFCGGMINW